VDFGTSTSLVAQRSGMQPVDVVNLGTTKKFVPSVASPSGGSYLVGEAADGLPANQVIRSVKRAITEEKSTVRVGGTSGGVEVAADDVMRAILHEVSLRAQGQGVALRSEPVVRMGCPAAWHRGQRQRVLDLARSVGLPVDHTTLIDEPVAAGVAWLTARYLRSADPVSGRLVVFDMGGGTLDIAVLDVVGGARPRVRVLASDGVARAGDTLDQAIADTLRERLGVDLAGLPNPALAEAVLLLLSREAKERLSLRDSHPVVLSRQHFGAVSPLRLTRVEVEELMQPQMQLAEQLLWHQLRIARLTHHRGASTQDVMRCTPVQLAGDVTYVLLAGGMSNVPFIRRRLRELFPQAQVHDTASDDIAPDETIVAGLADTVGYDGLSMHRPAFDVFLEWYYGSTPYRLELYAGYTPLFTGYQLMMGQSALGYERRLDRAAMPQDGVARLRAVAPGGAPLALHDGRGTHSDGVDVRFGSHEMLFKLYADGLIRLTDGSGFEHALRADGWLPILGVDSAPEPVDVPDPVPHYPFNREALNLPELTSWY
jgi:molecular chaperone DnaK (HSP70)